MTKAKVFIRYAIVYLAFLILSCYMANYGDDFVFKAGIERYGSFFGWVNFFARMWGGRIVPQGILVLLLQLPEIVFHLFDAFAWVLLLIYIKKVFDADEMLPFWFVCCAVSIMIFVLIPISVLTGSVLWKCANVLYLWGSAGILIGIYPLIRQLNDRAVRKRDMVFSTIAIVYTSSFEQAAALLCGAYALLLFFVVLNKKTSGGQLYFSLFYRWPAVCFLPCSRAIRSDIRLKFWGRSKTMTCILLWIRYYGEYGMRSAVLRTTPCFFCCYWSSPWHS